MSEQNEQQELVKVRRQWNDWRIIEVPLLALSDFQIRESSGGLNVKSPYPMLYAIMSCTSIPEGKEFAHSCQHGEAPHNILVCITKKDNPRNLYKMLRDRVESS